MNRFGMNETMQWPYVDGGNHIDPRSVGPIYNEALKLPYPVFPKTEEGGDNEID